VILTGSGFLTGVTVTFGGVPGTDVAILDSSGTRLSVVAPAHAAGTVDVAVTNSDGRSGALSAAYAFTAPIRVAPRLRIPRPLGRP
jgi:hypothetical protein